MDNPIPCWTIDGFRDVAAPFWWEEALEMIWPDSGAVTYPLMAHEGKLGRRLEVFPAEPAGKGYVVALYDRAEQVNAWLPRDRALQSFLEVKNDAWLGLDMVGSDRAK